MKAFTSIEEWRAEAKKRFGDNPKNWKFICPSCGHIASAQDWIDVGASPSEIAFSCVGRHTEKPYDAFQKGKSPCNYAGGGLIQLNPIIIRDGEKELRVFDFAPEA